MGLTVGSNRIRTPFGSFTPAQLVKAAGAAVLGKLAWDFLNSQVPTTLPVMMTDGERRLAEGLPVLTALPPSPREQTRDLSIKAEPKEKVAVALTFGRTVDDDEAM